jgi:hypothetical protein
MHPVISIAHHAQPHPQFRQQFQDYQRLEVPLDDPNTLLVMCSDNAILAVRYATTTDFLDLLRTQRLMPVVMQLREQSDWSYLLLDGQLTWNNSGKAVNNGNATGFDWTAIQGALLSIQELGVQVVTIQGSRYLQDAIFNLAKRDRAPKGIRPVRDAFWYSAAENILLALSGIGEERCAALLKMYGSAAWALDQLCDPETKVDGIGETTKAKIRHELGVSTTTRLAMIGLRPDTEIGYEVLHHDTTTRSSDHRSIIDEPARRAA